MLIKTISCVIIVKNAAATIEHTLESLKSFEDVVLYDNGSTDSTIEIAKKYSNINLIQGKFSGFGPTKNRAATFAKNEWILSLDADETVSTSLIEELKHLKLDNAKEVFILKRDNYFLGKEVKHSGWGSDYLTRIYNKTYHNFNQNIVHEFVELKNETKKTKLKSSFKHNAVQDINSFLYKIASYSDLASKNKKTCCFLTVLLKAKWAFFKTYFLQLGILDGWRGFFIASTNAYSKFFRYTKRYINCKK
ncbi:glycosyltransferase family 2 protein [Sulfurimonas sp. CVO]|nr:glycosyltransferase family 2 protein [Sulfurimonas sp. CVO]